MNNHYILKNRKVIKCNNLLLWSKWFHDNIDERRVERTYFDDGSYVSTVFLGLDHGFDGIPLFFETMIFDSNGHELDDGYCERCTTWEQAIDMHQSAVEYMRNNNGSR